MFDKEDLPARMAMWTDAETKLRSAASAYREHQSPELLAEIHRQALRMLASVPERDHEVLPLLKSLMPPK